MLWGTAPWITSLPKPVTPFMRTPFNACFKMDISIHPTPPWNIHITRTRLARIRKFLKIETVRRYTCKRTGEEKIVQDSGIDSDPSSKIKQTHHVVCLRLVGETFDLRRSIRDSLGSTFLDMDWWGCVNIYVPYIQIIFRISVKKYMLRPSITELGPKQSYMNCHLGSFLGQHLS